MINALKSLADRLASSPRRLWAVSFAIFLTLGAAWTFSTPTGASPDEHAHLIRAAAVARGQIEGKEVMVPHVVAGIKGNFAETEVTLPKFYEDLKDVNACYVFESNKPADCAPRLKATDETTKVSTAAGRYNPAYYLAVGWPSLIIPGEMGLYMMRLVSAALCAALVASAVVSAAEWRRRSLAMLGVVTAATPMALFMFGVVNPSGSEIAAGILVWSAGLPILMSPDRALLKRRLHRLGIGAVVLISIRPLGLIWFAGAVVFALLLQERGALRMVRRCRTAWLWAGILGATTLLALVWSALHPDHSVINTPASLTPMNAARKTFESTQLYIVHMIGFFGWLDAPSPSGTQLVWISVVLALALLALCYARLKEALAVLGVLFGIVFIPIVAHAIQAPQLGMIWQGRYLLPFAVGLPIMSAAICHRLAPRNGFPWQRLVMICGFSLSVVNVAAFVWALRRNAVGTQGSFFISPAHWVPPGGWPFWVVVYTAGALALACFVAMTDRKEQDEPTPVGRSTAPTAVDTDGGRGPLAALRAEA